MIGLNKKTIEFLVKIHKREHKANIKNYKILNTKKKKNGYIDLIVYIKDDQEHNYAYLIHLWGEITGIQEL